MVTIHGVKIADVGYYINLDRRTDRKEHLLSNLEEYNIVGVERQSAREDTNTPQLNLVNTTFDIYEKFLNTDAETLLILEDDCKFLDPLKTKYKEIMSDINSTDWDLFWLGGINRKPPVFYKNNCYRVSSPNYAQSYIIKRKMAEDILKHFKNDWCHLNPDELLCLFTYEYDVSKDPFGLSFYEKDQPLNHFNPIYTCLCYEYSLSTQFNSYSDLWGYVTFLENWIPAHHLTKKHD